MKRRTRLNAVAIEFAVVAALVGWAAVAAIGGAVRTLFG